MLLFITPDTKIIRTITECILHLISLKDSLYYYPRKKHFKMLRYWGVSYAKHHKCGIKTSHKWLHLKSTDIFSGSHELQNMILLTFLIWPSQMSQMWQIRCYGAWKFITKLHYLNNTFQRSCMDEAIFHKYFLNRQIVQTTQTKISYRKVIVWS